MDVPLIWTAPKMDAQTIWMPQPTEDGRPLRWTAR